MKLNYTYNLMRDAEIVEGGGGFSNLERGYEQLYRHCCAQRDRLTKQIKDQQELLELFDYEFNILPLIYKQNIRLNSPDAMKKLEQKLNTYKTKYQ